MIDSTNHSLWRLSFDLFAINKSFSLWLLPFDPLECVCMCERSVEFESHCKKLNYTKQPKRMCPQKGPNIKEKEKLTTSNCNNKL